MSSTSHWRTSVQVSEVFVDASPGGQRPSDEPTTYNERYCIDFASASETGRVLCFTSGRRLEDGVNYTDCGAIKDLGRTVNYNGTVVGGLGVLSSTQSLGGTSGGPYYKLGRGYGVHSGSDDSAGEQYYLGLIEALNAYSLRLVQDGIS